MQPDSGNGAITALQAAFTEKYNEPISTEILTQLAIQYGGEAVTRVIEQMKPDAYEAADYLKLCLSSGWYQTRKSEGGGRKAEGNAKGMSSEAAKTLRFTWNYKMERGWISRDERDFMLDVILNGTSPKDKGESGKEKGESKDAFALSTQDEERVQDISFRVLQGMYPNAPATWFYWLPQHQRRATANTWIAKSGREDLTPYEIT